ncbi:MAG: disulfide bond formation protein B [Pseudomonadales bacterium]|nr:disulfide bond formation protein B [Pseudomonadales bacterium]
MNQFQDSSEAWATMIVGVCGVLLCGALVMEYALGLAPCPLCLMQRIWFGIAGLIAVGGLLHSSRWGIYPLLSMLAALVGAGFALRQLYLQNLPAEQVPACGPDMAYAIENFPFADVLAMMTRGTGDCAQVSWQFIGISLPGWALLGFVVLIVLSALQLRAASVASR